VVIRGKKYMSAMATESERAVKKTVAPVAKLNAAPELRISVNFNNEPRISLLPSEN
jgi:hypothetical protein